MTFNPNKQHFDFSDLILMIEALRGEGGCPWDKEQTHESLKPQTIEEVYEVIEAIDNADMANLKEELGDVLLHVVFHSQIARENEDFEIGDVIHELVTKMVRRHPHVFGNRAADSADEVLVNWEQIKQEEKTFTSYTQELLSVPRALPSLLRAYKVQKKAGKIGFDFPDVDSAMDKLEEELNELKKAVKTGQKAEIDEEFGDILFSIVNISRFLKINPEIGLTNAIEKFINRFMGIEHLANEQGKSLDKLSLREMDDLWEAYKKKGLHHS